MLLEVAKLQKKKANRKIKLRFGKLRLENCAEGESFWINVVLQIREKLDLC